MDLMNKLGIYIYNKLCMYIYTTGWKQFNLKPILSQCKNFLLANFPSSDNNDVNIVYNSPHPQEKKIILVENN